MPSIRYVNQSAPFWDFVASLENQGSNHPFFAQGSDEEAQWDPWGWARPPHRGGWHRGPRHGPPHHRHEGPAGPSESPRGPSPPPPPPGHDGPAPPHYEGPPPPAPPHHEGPPPPEHEHHGPPPHHRGGPWAGRRGGRCGQGARGGSVGGPFNLGALGEFFQSQVFGDNTETGAAAPKSEPAATSDFTPEADVFDTESAYIVHLSLPGAKKEDLGVNWDPEKSELSVTGVIHRPGDEELLKTLALDERKVGPFERKVRLGSRANPAQVDVDMITAKLEDGILRVEVPKLDKDYVEIKKVDIE
ncbi:hypothetical protein W97_01402 [Coniosporium apollinis CBS 100218]|uniref:SHSP domain-containing protein n=1 Tax=Coniosporium apollinis (strain CBS 100218) TaxID=1168221 RepID=R7YJT7_CONA1|nr:uncharacterized protein W97_01402 [Coniosporium apollinis CBS 100218]EON62182.1 hypothetical protein W97_01402 [Coniosporium apollinis CBS 100218]